MIADLGPYSEYKESGLPWLGCCPRHWVIKRGKSNDRRRPTVDGEVEEELLTVALRTRGYSKEHRESDDVQGRSLMLATSCVGRETWSSTAFGLGAAVLA